MGVSAIATAPALKPVAMFGSLIECKYPLGAFLECLVPLRLEREVVDIALAVVLVEGDYSELFNVVSALPESLSVNRELVSVLRVRFDCAITLEASERAIVHRFDVRENER